MLADKPSECVQLSKESGGLLTIATSLGVLAGVMLAVVGIWLLQYHGDQPGVGVTLLALGCALLAWLPRGAALMLLFAWRRHLAILLWGVALFLFLKTCGTVIRIKTPDWEQLTLEWLLSVGVAIVAGFLWSGPSERQLSKRDTILAVGIFLAAVAVRCFAVVTRSPNAIIDELHVFSANLSSVAPPAESPFGTLNSFPAFWYWLVYFLYPLAQPFVDKFAFEKALAASAGAMSVAAWYLVMRLWGQRASALCAASLLCFLGWHWVNSRLLYCYPFDLAFISLATLSLVLALRSDNIGFACLAGAFSALTLVFQKVGVMIVPLLGYVLVDSYLSGEKSKRTTVVKTGIAWLSLMVLLYLPVVLYGMSQNAEGLLPRQAFMAGGRSHALAERGLTQGSAALLMAKDVFYQLLIRESDQLRHLFRMEGTLLDPVFAGVFLIGLFTAIRGCWKWQAARVALVGFVLFTLPMALSFPVDGGAEHGLARRMVGVSLFAAWFGGIGAVSLAERIAPVQMQRTVLAVLCAASAFINAKFLYSYYLPASVEVPGTLERDLAIQRASAIKTVRALAATGVKTLYLADSEPMPASLPTKDIKMVLADLPSAEQLGSLEDLKSRLRAHNGQPAFVVVPSATATLGKHYQDIPVQLAELIPSYLWVPGPPDQHGIVTVWYAFVYPG